jgi:hypothetical protein
LKRWPERFEAGMNVVNARGSLQVGAIGTYMDSDDVVYVVAEKKRRKDSRLHHVSGSKAEDQLELA